MPVKQADGVYELPSNFKEQDIASKKYNVPIDDYATPREFYSDNVTLNGKPIRRLRGEDIDWESESVWDDELAQKVGYNKAKEQAQIKYWEKRGSTMIPGLKCPDCNAQAFKTDQKNVAVCGDYPGWFFFYRRTDLDKSAKSKISIKIINGVPTYVDESGQEVNKNE